MILIDASLRIAVVVALVGLVLMVMRVRASGVRHAVWTLVLVAMLLMPILPSIVPAVAVPMPAAASRGLPLALIPSDVGIERSPSSTGQAAPATATRITVPSEDVHPALSPPRPVWALWSVIGAAYLIVAIALLLRLIAGCIAVTRLSRSARRIDFEALGSSAGLALPQTVRESPCVAAPVTAGVFAPSIILPVGWRAWTPEKLRACLAHEVAHMQRLDTLTTFVAQLNRCVFWFHPIAWWLERTLAASAEDAADEAAVREIGNRRRYAEVLLDVADNVRARGARVAWQAIGADGNGRLGRRVDRVLQGEAGPDVSRTRKTVLFLTCTAAVLIVVACRQAAAPPPLRPDPVVAERLEKQKADQAFYERAKNMTAAEVDALEASLKKTPGDLEARKTLRHFYQISGQKMFGWDQMIARRRPHVLWLVENHPEHDLAVWPVSAEADPVTYAEVKKRWLAHTSKPDVSQKVLNNAASFFARFEPQIAEGLLLRAKAPSRLGYLYGDVIKGPVNPRDGSPLTPLDSAPYARQVRQRLMQSNDPVVLRAAGQRLMTSYRDEGRRQIGQRLLRRALELNPQQSDVRSMLAGVENNVRGQHMRKALWMKSAELAGEDIAQKVRAGHPLTEEESAKVAGFEEPALAQLPETERFALLPGRADLHYSMAEYWNHVNKPERATELWARSKKYAQEALALAPKLRDHPDFGYVVYTANVVFATNVLREGDKAQAVRYMLAASEAPASEKLVSGMIVTEQRIVNYLLKDGERDSVVQFLERAATLRTAQRERLLKDAAAIRAGTMPPSYQYMMSR